MKQLTLIGAGVAGLTFIEEIRAKDKILDIILIDKSFTLLKKQEFFANPLGKISLDLKTWAEKYSVKLKCGFVERINYKKRKIYFKESGNCDFENLVIACGLESKKLTLKGGHQDGCFYLSGIEVLKVKDLLKFSEDITVYAQTLLGFKLALAIRLLNKEVRLVINNCDFLKERKLDILANFTDKGILIHQDSVLEEVIGEKIVRAVKISPLKVFSAQVVFIDSGFIPNGKFFEDSIAIKDDFFSDIEGIYFLGDVSNRQIVEEKLFTYNYKEAKEKASLLAKFVLEGIKPNFEQRKGEEYEDKNNIFVFNN